LKTGVGGIRPSERVSALGDEKRINRGLGSNLQRGGVFEKREWKSCGVGGSGALRKKKEGLGQSKIPMQEFLKVCWVLDRWGWKGGDSFSAHEKEVVSGGAEEEVAGSGKKGLGKFRIVRWLVRGGKSEKRGATSQLLDKKGDRRSLLIWRVRNEKNLEGRDLECGSRNRSPSSSPRKRREVKVEREKKERAIGSPPEERNWVGPRERTLKLFQLFLRRAKLTPWRGFFRRRNGRMREGRAQSSSRRRNKGREGKVQARK